MVSELVGRRPKVGEKVREVEELRLRGASVGDACARVGLPVSTFYYRPRGQQALARAGHERRVRQALAELRARNPRAGYRGLARRLREAGLVANHKLVYRLCREAGWLRAREDLGILGAGSIEGPKVRSSAGTARGEVGAPGVSPRPPGA